MAFLILDKHHPEYLTKMSVDPGGLLMVDKPIGWTSFDVVAKLRNQLRKLLDVKKLKVGHAGTLDPMATGLLLVAVGRMTKQIHTFQDQTKLYSGTMQLGARTPSYDAETEVIPVGPFDHLSQADLQRVVSTQFTGGISQLPPMYSAIKKDGKALYKLARKGEVVERDPRSVHIFHYDITLQERGVADFTIKCSKGTYIRSLAHDLGEVLGCGAYLTALRRDAIGDYNNTDAWNMNDLVLKLQELINSGHVD